MITNEKKEEVWGHFSRIKPFPYGVTPRRLGKVKIIIWDWDYFWKDIVIGHGLLYKSPESLRDSSYETYSHAVGNFWGLVVEKMLQNNIVPLASL